MYRFHPYLDTHDSLFSDFFRAVRRDPGVVVG